MKIVVTIPAHNEEKSVGKVISDLGRVMKDSKYDYKILVVDDGSTDRTAEIAKRAGAIVVKHPYRYGLAEAFRTEMKESLKLDPDIIVHTDADSQYMAEEIEKLIKPIRSNEADVVLGSRFLGKIEHMPLIKRIGNIIFSRIVSQVSGLKITDSQTGFRAFTKQFAESIEIKSSHTYTQEMIIRAKKQKFKIKEVPVTFKKRLYGKSRLMQNPLEYGIKALVSIVRIYRDYQPLRFFGSFGIALLSLGVLIGLYLLWGFANFGISQIYKEDLTILTMILFFLSGLQLLLFGFLADKS